MASSTSHGTLGGDAPGQRVTTTATSSLDPALAARLREAAGDDGVITDPGALLVYEADGLMAYRTRPLAVV
ncbi:MAG: FAD-binding oxidoreductase, partial [Longimicrobiales bacterium]